MASSEVSTSSSSLAIESNFAKKLASNNPKIRKKAIKSLKNWLSNKANAGTAFKEDELLNFWKGLFYSMWMCDKALVQEDLAERLASLLHAFPMLEGALQFVDAFLKTMSREWFSIDRYRIDKFLMLVRQIIRETFVIVFAQKAQKVLSIRKMNDMLSNTIFDCQPDAACPISLAVHVTDFYLEEIKYVSKGKLKPKMIMKIVKPFCVVITRCKRLTQLTSVRKSIFNVILDDAVYHTMEKKSSEAIEGSDNDDVDSEDDMEYVDIKCKKFTYHNTKEALPIKFNCDAVADMLLKMSKKKVIGTKNRKLAYNIVKKLRGAAQGHDSLVSKLKIKEYNPEEASAKFEASVDRLVDDFQEDAFCKREWKIYKKAVSDEVRLNKVEANAEEHDSEEPTVTRKSVKRKKKESKKSKRLKIQQDQSLAEKQEISEESITDSLSQNDETVDIAERSSTIVDPGSEQKFGKKNKNKKKKSASLDQNSELVDDSEKVKNGIESSAEVPTADSPMKSEGQNGVAASSKSQKKKKESRYFTEDMPTESTEAENGEIEIFIPNKKYKGKSKHTPDLSNFGKFEKVMKTPPAFVKGSVRKVKSATGPLRKKMPMNFNSSQTLETPRRVNFVLEKNKSHEHRDYNKAVQDSPVLPFNAMKTPTQGVLKKKFT